MMVDFFNERYKIEVADKLFGLCDDSKDNNKTPAYLDIDDKEKWIAEIYNNNSKQVAFYPLDCCVKWFLPDGNQAKVCDGMLSYNEQKNIIFIELKDRNPNNKQWRIKAEKQLKSTIDRYKISYSKNLALIKAYVSNKQLLFDESNDEFMECFKKETGVTLRYSRKIDVI